MQFAKTEKCAPQGQGSPADVRAFDRHGIVCTQPAGDKEKENFGRQWDQRVELMRDVTITPATAP